MAIDSWTGIIWVGNFVACTLLVSNASIKTWAGERTSLDEDMRKIIKKINSGYKRQKARISPGLTVTWHLLHFRKMHACSHQRDYSSSKTDWQCWGNSQITVYCQINCLPVEKTINQNLWLSNKVGLQRFKEKIYQASSGSFQAGSRHQGGDIETQDKKTFWPQENQHLFTNFYFSHDHSPLFGRSEFSFQTTKFQEAFISKRLFYETS